MSAAGTLLATVWLSAVGQPERLVTLGAAVTETACALGLESSIVGVDTTSQYPPSIGVQPKVGYIRSLSAEGVLSLAPTRVIASASAGPSGSLSAWRSAGILVELVDEAKTWPEAKERMLAVGRLVGRSELALDLTQNIDRRLARLRARLARVPRPRVLFVFAHGRAPVVAGEGTIADTMIKLSGGANALGGIRGYKPPTAESVIDARPEVIVTTDNVVDGLGGQPGVLRLPGLSATPAAKSGRVVVMDAILLLGLGPRTAEAAGTLARSLHPELWATNDEDQP